MREIQWLKEAEDELADIVDYVFQNQGQKVALKVYENIISHIDSLAEFPELGTPETKYKFKAAINPEMINLLNPLLIIVSFSLYCSVMGRIKTCREMK